MPNRARIIILGLVAIFVWGLYLGSVWMRYTSYATDSKAYLGISLGASMDEVRYALGTPQSVLLWPAPHQGPWGLSDPQLLYNDAKHSLNSMPSDKSDKDYLGWLNDKNGIDYEIDFDAKNKTVTKLSCTDLSSDIKSNCPDLFGVSSKIGEDWVIKRLGVPDRQEYGSGGTKTYFYDGLGFEVTLAQKKVYIVKKYVPKGETTLWMIRHIWL